jgi:hypothetical protein
MNLAATDIAAEAETIAAALEEPGSAVPGRAGWTQSLAEGAAGIAVLHTHRARTGAVDWHTAHRWLAVAASDDLDAGTSASLFFGAPAVGFALHQAAHHEPGRYRRALTAIDAAVLALAAQRVKLAHQRIDNAAWLALAEFDLIDGLTGIGAYLLHVLPDHPSTAAVLGYLVRLTRPLKRDGRVWPGWWTDLAPSGAQTPQFPGGHANNGMAHGIAGPLALLALAYRHGISVDGQAEAIDIICAWLDQWQQAQRGGAWWPQWINRADLDTGHPSQTGPLRPSWCYGTPGLARAQQLAGLARHDRARQHLAIDAITACLNDPDQLARVADASLCHGTAGLIQTTRRIAADANNPQLDARALVLLRDVPRITPAEPGLLDGAAGYALTLHSVATSPESTWDTCLLLS